MTQHTYGWADLDAANSKHYGRGKPAELIDAESSMNEADARYQKAVDEYYDNHYGEREYYRTMIDAGRTADQESKNYQTVYARVYGTPQDAHLEASYDDKTDF
jgi:hypothetical protein